MPPIPRSKKLNDVREYLVHIREAIAAQEPKDNIAGVHRLLVNLRDGIKRLEVLQADARDRADNSFQSNVGTRRVFDLAAIEMDVAIADLEDAYAIAENATNFEEMKEFYSYSLKATLRLKHIKFAAPISRPKPTRDEMIENEKMETSLSEQAFTEVKKVEPPKAPTDPTTNPTDSNLNKYQDTGKLGDDSLKALGDILK